MEIARRCVPYTPVERSRERLTLMLVSTAGVHGRDQEPFATGPLGDTSFRVIPGDVHSDSLVITHAAPAEHYDRSEAQRDINVIFPIDRLRELAAAGEIAGVAEKHISLMGYAQKQRAILQETAPAVAAEVERSQADAVLLTAG